MAPHFIEMKQDPRASALGGVRGSAPAWLVSARRCPNFCLGCFLEWVTAEDDRINEQRIAEPAWKRMLEAAEHHNDPGGFTAPFGLTSIRPSAPSTTCAGWRSRHLADLVHSLEGLAMVWGRTGKRLSGGFGTGTTTIGRTPSFGAKDTAGTWRPLPSSPNAGTTATTNRAPGERMCRPVHRVSKEARANRLEFYPCLSLPASRLGSLDVSWHVRGDTNGWDRGDKGLAKAAWNQPLAKSEAMALAFSDRSHLVEITRLP